MIEVYINKKIQYWIDTLTDLFCLEDNKPIIKLSLIKSNQNGHCTYPTDKENSKITIGYRDGKLRLSVLVHEFIHAMGYDHEYELNGWANFRSCSKLDNYSPLIVKDLTGKKELII